MNTIADAAQALAGLLRAAESDGLPLPYHANLTEHPPSNHPGYTYEILAAASLLVQPRDLAAWSKWLNADPYDDGEPYYGEVHRHVDAFAGPIPIRVTALVPVAEAVA